MREPNLRRNLRNTLWTLLTLLAAAGAASAAAPPCKPCAGIRVADPDAVVERLAAEPRIADEARLYVAWPVGASAEEAVDTARRAAAVEAAGGTPWLRVLFGTPAPLTAHLEELEAELAGAAELAAAAGSRPHLQILWHPLAGGAPAGEAAGETERAASADLAQYAFLLKRAAVATGGANPDVRIVTAPLPPDPTALATLYGEEVAAYVDGAALRPAPPEALAAALEAVAELDPGKPAVVDALPFPGEPLEALADAARLAVAGAAVTFFDLRAAPEASLDPLKILAREFQGDVSFDPYSTPSSDGEAWSFVRGEDLGLRVIARRPPAAADVVLTFSDSQLLSPVRVDPETGEGRDLFGLRRTERGLVVRLEEAAPVSVLRLERMAVAELEGVAGVVEELTVTSERQLPVEEILRRLQAFEDAQARRLRHFEATNTSHLRFQAGGAGQGVEVTFEGRFFFRQREGYDWAWERFLVNGLRWRGKQIPEIPLIEPEKAATLPLEITFGRDYRYRLRGTAEVDGRDCWVVDFEPLGPVEGRSLYQGTVWIDRAIFARVRTRALQLGLQGEVISNEETIHYSPVDRQGHPVSEAAEGASESFWLPLRVVGQQIWSILNSATVVEKETLLTGITVNGAEFEAARREVLASESTMVRDTEAGLRYLVKDPDSGERVVQEGFDTNRLFLVGGVFYDDALDYPLPLAGVNYFSFDFKGTGAQVNAFFAGVLAVGSISDTEFLGSRFDAGADLFGIGIPFTENHFRDNREVPGEEVEVRPARLSLTLGRPIGNFAKVNLRYGLRHDKFSRGDDTDEAFVLPADHFTHSFGLDARYNRAGYRLRLGGTWARRSTWEPWGLPGSNDFDPDAETYVQWGAGIEKTFHLKRFRKAGIELEMVDGRDLDRFSKYQFGFFSDIRVHGYQSERVKAEKAAAAHVSYGFELGEVFRLQLVGDAAWATDREAGFDREFLGGVGLVGNFIGPWQTLVNLDVGVPVAGPDDGFTLFLAFLKLFR